MDFDFKRFNSFNFGQNQNMLLDFFELTFNYAKWIFSKYSRDYSIHIHNQPQLFTILAMNLLKPFIDEFEKNSIDIRKIDALISTHISNIILKIYEENLEDDLIKNQCLDYMDIMVKEDFRGLNFFDINST